MATHQFDVDTAILHGVEAAILLENIRFWLEKNRANGVNAKEGFWWTYNSAEAFHKLFPYISKPTITRVLKRLTDGGVLLSKNLNQSKFDRTFWYTIPGEFSIAQNEPWKTQNEPAIMQNEPRKTQNEPRKTQNEPRKTQNEPPIPDINTRLKTTDDKQQINKAVDKFVPPTVEDVKKYADEINAVNFDAAVFVDYYKANGWMVGKNKMKDWRATVRNWLRRGENQQRNNQPDRKDFSTPAQYIPNPLGAGTEKQIN